MLAEKLSPVFGIKDALAYTAFDEVSTRYKFLKHWLNL